MDFPDFPEIPLEEADNIIAFHYEQVEVDLPAEEKVTKWLFDTVAEEGKEVHEVTFIFCSDDYLLDINREHLQHDYYTDVITFPYSSVFVHGDIFISADRVADNARTNKVSAQHELCRVMVHGVLHLSGYSDKTEEERAVMTEKENFYLKKADWIN